MISQQAVKKAYTFVLGLYLGPGQWNRVSSSWHVFPLKHISYLMNTWLLFSFLMFKKIAFLSFLGLGLVGFQKCNLLTVKMAQGAEVLLYSTSRVTGCRHQTEHHVGLSHNPLGVVQLPWWWRTPGGVLPVGAHLAFDDIRHALATRGLCLQLCSDLICCSIPWQRPWFVFCTSWYQNLGLWL